MVQIGMVSDKWLMRYTPLQKLNVKKRVIPRTELNHENGEGGGAVFFFFI